MRTPERNPSALTLLLPTVLRRAYGKFGCGGGSAYGYSLA